MLGAVATASLTAMTVSAATQSFLDYRSYHQQSASMEPTIRPGETLLVDTGCYRSRRPDRGDVVVFAPPKSDAVRFVMRVIGLPGDRIKVVAGTVHINEQPTGRERIGDAVENTTRGDRVTRWRETLSSGVSYMTFEYDWSSPVLRGRNTDVYTVPPESYFVMGDHRDNAADSRFSDGFVGYLPFKNITGCATRIAVSTDVSRIGLVLLPQSGPVK
jgi:signal peptidase I